MQENYLETGTTEGLYQLGERIGFSQLWKMSSVPKLISVNYHIKLTSKS